MGATILIKRSTTTDTPASLAQGELAYSEHSHTLHVGVAGPAVEAVGGTGAFVATSGNQTIAGTKTFSAAIAADITGNAATVTNGVYTTGAGTVFLAPSGSGTSLTSLNGSNISTGTVAAARLGSGTPSNANWLRGDGTWITPYATSLKNANASVGVHERFLYCDAASAGFTLTLPVASTASGNEFIFFRADGTANVITLSRTATDLFWGGGTSMTLPTTTGKFIRLVAVAPNLWIVTGSN